MKSSSDEHLTTALKDSSLLVTVDPILSKRTHSIEENGLEHYARDQTDEERLLKILPVVDVSQSKKKENSINPRNKRKKEADEQTWPWQDIIQHLLNAQEELRPMLDLIDKVEESQNVRVANVQRTKLQAGEVTAELALRVSGKQTQLRAAGKDLRNSSLAIGRLLDHEAKFYSSLVRLQKRWKVKRQRTSAGLHLEDTAGFTIDLSCSVLSQWSHLPSQLAPLDHVALQQEKTGILNAKLPEGKCLRQVRLTISSSSSNGVANSRPSSLQNVGSLRTCPSMHGDHAKGSESKGSDWEARPWNAHDIICSMQTALFEEKLFENLELEAMGEAAQGLLLTGVSGNSFTLTLGPSSSLHINLEDTPMTDGTDDQELQGSESVISGSQEPHGLLLFLRQLYHKQLFPRSPPRVAAMDVGRKAEKGFSTGVLGANGRVMQVHAIVKHRAFRSVILAELEKLADCTPGLRLCTQPAPDPCVSVWSLAIELPKGAESDKIGQARKNRASAGEVDKQKAVAGTEGANLTLTVVAKGEEVTVEEGRAWSGLSILTSKSASHGLSGPLGIFQLSKSVLQSLALRMTRTLCKEANALGIETTQDMLVLTMRTVPYGIVMLVALPLLVSHSVHWKLSQPPLQRTVGLSSAFKAPQEPVQLMDTYLGPLSWDKLKGILIDFLPSVATLHASDCVG